MGVFTFENQGAYSFLVYELGSEDVIDTLSLGMITGNRISGISQAVFTQMDDKKFIKYNISTKVSVDQFFLGSVNKKRLLGVFSSMASAFVSADDYMIDRDSLLLDLKYMYADVRSCDAVLICLPVIQTEKHPIDLHKFFKEIMFSTQFDQTENCDYIGQILNYLNGAAPFSIVEFKILLDGLLKPKPAIKPIQVSVAPQIVISQPQALSSSVQQPEAVPSRPQIPAAPSPVQSPSAAPQDKGKDISLFYLLQHYNKENAEEYNKQKARKKSAKPKAATAKDVPSKQPAKPVQPAGYAIPGAASQFYAVPGTVPQQTVISSNLSSGSPLRGVAAPSVQPVYIPRQEMVQQSASFGETTVLGAGPAAGETTVLGQDTSTEVTPFLIRSKNNERIPLNKAVFRIGKEKSYVDYFVSDNTAVSRSHADIISKNGEYFIQDNNSTNHSYVNNIMIPSNTPVQLEDGYTFALANDVFKFERK